MSWWKSLRSAIGLAPPESAPDYDQVHWLDFTLGQGFPVPLPPAPDRQAHVLPPSLLPGMSLVGQFSFFKTGQVQVAHQGGAFEHPLALYPGFKAMIFVPVDNLAEPEQLWQTIEGKLESIYRRSLLACLGDEARNGDPEDSAIAHLSYLKAEQKSGKLDAEGEAFLSRLESAPLFCDFSQRSRDGGRLSVRDLQKSASISLVNREQGARLKALPGRTDVIFLADSRELERLVENYGLPGDNDISRDLLHEVSCPKISQQERDLAIPLLDGQATRDRSELRFACLNHPPLRVDLRERKLIGPRPGCDPAVEIHFHELTRVDLEEDVEESLGKLASTFYLVVSGAGQTLIFQQTFAAPSDSTGFPTGSDVYLLHGLARALDFEGARLRREDLATDVSLLDLIASDEA